MQHTNLSRRAMLGGSAAACAVVAPSATHGDLLFRMMDIGAKARQHPDAELFAAWHDYVSVSEEFDNMPIGTTDAEAEPLAKRLDQCRDRLEQAPIRTLEGMNLKLRYLFAMMLETKDAIDAAIFQQPLTDELAKVLSQDYREAMLWQMIQSTTSTALAA